MNHPLLVIPPLPLDAPPIHSERGELRPERALVYNDATFLLHHAVGHRPSQLVTDAELAGYGKTAQRLIALLQHFNWAKPHPLHWQSPEVLLFTSCNDGLLHDLAQLKRLLVQAEQLSLHTLEGFSYLRFQRA